MFLTQKQSGSRDEDKRVHDLKLLILTLKNFFSEHPHYRSNYHVCLTKHQMNYKNIILHIIFYSSLNYDANLSDAFIYNENYANIEWHTSI